MRARQRELSQRNIANELRSVLHPLLIGLEFLELSEWDTLDDEVMNWRQMGNKGGKLTVEISGGEVQGRYRWGATKTKQRSRHGGRVRRKRHRSELPWTSVIAYWWEWDGGRTANWWSEDVLIGKEKDILKRPCRFEMPSLTVFVFSLSLFDSFFVFLVMRAFSQEDSVFLTCREDRSYNKTISESAVQEKQEFLKPRGRRIRYGGGGGGI